jgi:hypothetical protein
MSASDLDQAIANILAREKTPLGGQWLRDLAFNRTCEEIGHPESKVNRPVYNLVTSVLA